MTKRAMAAAAALVALALGGCWEESGEITLHEAGEYKGVPDPLLAQDSAQRADSLEKRFALIQTDR